MGYFLHCNWFLLKYEKCYLVLTLYNMNNHEWNYTISSSEKTMIGKIIIYKSHKPHVGIIWKLATLCHTYKSFLTLKFCILYIKKLNSLLDFSRNEKDLSVNFAEIDILSHFQARNSPEYQTSGIREQSILIQEVSY